MRSDLADPVVFGSDSEVALCVVAADALHDLLQGSLVVRIFAVLYPLTDQVAHDAAEVVVTGVGEEGAGIRQHSDKIAENAEIAE